MSVICSDSRAAKTLLEHPNIDVNAADEAGRTALQHAANEGRVELLELLLGREDIVPDVVDKNGVTPMMMAKAHGKINIVKKLVKNQT